MLRRAEKDDRSSCLKQTLLPKADGYFPKFTVDEVCAASKERPSGAPITPRSQMVGIERPDALQTTELPTTALRPP